MLLLAARAGEPLLASLARALGHVARVVPTLPAASDVAGIRLVVGVASPADVGWLRALATWSGRVNVPSLPVERAAPGLRVGALTRPGCVGCGECARQRMAAAALGGATPAPAAGADDPAADTVLVAALAREVRALLRCGLQASQLVDHVLCLDAARAVATLHRVVPLARCPACGGASTCPAPAGPRARLSADDEPAALLEALAGWIDPLTGVIPTLVLERPVDTGLELPFVVSAAPPHVFDADEQPRRLPLGWGKGLSVSAAILSATGEAFERYAPSLPDVAGRVVWRRPDELEGEHLDPRALSLYDEAQYRRAGFAWARFDPSLRHPWVRGAWLHDGSPVWLPAVCTYLSLELRPEHLICQGTSNGLAAAGDFDDASLRATLELIERDAFLAAWLGGRPGRRIAPDATLEPPLSRVLAGLQALGAQVEFYRLDSAACGVVILALGLGDGLAWPGVTLGLGADLDARAAFRSALLELGQTGPHLRRLMRAGALAVPAAAHEVREMIEHAAYYFPAERARAFARLRADANPLALADLGPRATETSLTACRAALAAAGVRVAVADVTSADVATGPFRVVRALSPDLQPICFGWGCERLPVPRLRALGLAQEPPDVHPIW